MRSLLPLGLVLLATVPRASLAAMPVFPEVPAPEAYGRVVLDRGSTSAGIPPAVFDHWRHRAKFTCRLCHVDVGFAMQARASEISRATNRAGQHCGACHDGKTTYRGATIFAACSEKPFGESGACRRCHSLETPAKLRHEYLAFAEKLPVYGGGYVDWELAESRALVRPLDFVEGVSVARDALKLDRDVAIETKGTWLGGVTFSHRKHAVWNGCEVCHPEIFPSTSAGEVRYGMAEIRSGKACGACHKAVAFPIAQCRRCHARSAAEGAR